MQRYNPGAAHKVVLEFFTTSSDKPTYEMDIEAYSEGVMSDSDYHSEIWIPVVKKETSPPVFCG